MRVFIAIVIIIGILGGGFYYTQFMKPNNEVISISDDLYLIIEDKAIEEGNPVIFQDEILYFSYDVIKEYIDENLFYDEEEQVIIFTYKDKVKRYKIDDKKATVNSKEFFINNPIIRIDDKIYIPLDLFATEYELNIDYFYNTNAVVLDYQNIYYLSGEVILEGGSIRTDLDRKSPILVESLNIGSILNIYGEYEKWYKVRTLDGIPGFIEKKYLKLNHTKDIYKVELKDREEKKNNLAKINLTWDYTYSKVKNTDNITEIPGVNVISPTWFSLTDEEGTILDKGNIEYVKKYNELGYEIWPLINNNFDPDLTHELLKNSYKREKIVNDILKTYLDYGFQGINIDFENVHLKDRDLLTQFVRELYPIFRENGLIVSMDITAISTSENWSLSFDRKRLQNTVDYLMLMAYDQHWASSPIAGSVAQYSWVEESLIRIFEEIPKEKLVLGVPFYTRLWTIEDGKVSSKALSMDIANKFIKENNISLIWDEASGQYYGETEKEGKTYKIWMEDSKSLEYKTSLIHKYDLAGIASWRKGYETPDVWINLDKVLN